jgi:ABC-type sulfate transport system permease subunit
MGIAIPRTSWLWLTLPIAVLFHVAFQQGTPFIRTLSHPDQLQCYVALFVLLLMTFFGLRNVRKSAQRV